SDYHRSERSLSFLPEPVDMLMFLVVFLSVFIGMHTLFFFRIRVLFMDRAIVQGLVIAWFAVMILVPMASYLLEARGHDLPARIAAIIGFYWVGFLFLAFSACLLMGFFDGFAWLARALTRLDVPSLSGKVPALAMLGLVAATCLYGLYEAKQIRVEHLRIETGKLPEGVDSLRIAQISDVHLGLILRQSHMKAIIAELEALSPDILVCTGDYVDGSLKNLIHLTEYIEALHPRYGKYAVTGNHEYYAGLEKSLEFLEKSGFTVLRGEGTTIEGMITIAGVDDADVSGATRTDSAAEADLALRALPEVDPALFTLFLKHRPDVLPATLGRFDLQLSGHTHKGQMFPFDLLVKRQYPMLSGSHDLGGGARIHINRGVGTWGPPMRIFAPPEITLIELVRRG
ncbi:MAG: metallophosphoesterase, partial [Desulfobacterales bacterium]